METTTTPRRTIPIRNLVHGRSEYPRPKIEVGVMHTERDDEQPQIRAKFCALGDAWRYAQQIAAGDTYYGEIITGSKAGRPGPPRALPSPATPGPILLSPVAKGGFFPGGNLTLAKSQNEVVRYAFGRIAKASHTARADRGSARLWLGCEQRGHGQEPAPSSGGNARRGPGGSGCLGPRRAAPNRRSDAP